MKIKDLNPDILEQLVELECNNILPILASVGLNLTPQHMRDQLEFFKESNVVIRQSSNHVDGFAMYEINNSEDTVISFNLKKFNDLRILSTLLDAIFQHLKDTPIETIKSHAHHTNTKSLNFHRRMGFKEVENTQHHIVFEISKNDLLSTIAKRVKKPN